MGRIVRNVVDHDLLGGGDHAVQVELERFVFGERGLGVVEMHGGGLASGVVDDGIVGLEDALGVRERRKERTQWSSIDQKTMWLQQDWEGFGSGGSSDGWSR